MKSLYILPAAIVQKEFTIINLSLMESGIIHGIKNSQQNKELLII